MEKKALSDVTEKGEMRERSGEQRDDRRVIKKEEREDG